MLVSELREKLYERESNSIPITVDGPAYHDAQLVDTKTWDSYPMSQSVEETLCARYQIPYKFFDRCDVEIRNFLMGRFIAEAPSHKAYTIARDGVIDYISFSPFVYVSPTKMLDAVTTVMPPDVVANDLIASPTGLGFVLTTPNISKELKVGDIVNGGIALTYSDVGWTAPYVESYLNRLICTNGARYPMNRMKFRIEGQSEQAILGHVSAYARSAVARIDALLEQMEHSLEQRVSNPQLFLRQLATEHGIPQRLLQLIQYHFALNPGDTVFDVSNAITAAANTTDLSAQQRSFLQLIGARVISDGHARCTQCGHRVD